MDRRSLFGGGAGSILALAGLLSVPRGVSAQALSTGGLWGAFASGVGQLGDVLSMPGVPQNAIDQAEGARLLARYLTLGLDFCLEYADPAFPALFQGTRDGVRKYAGDNPDETYLHATVSPEYTYRLTGSMRGALIAECGVYSGDAFLDPKANPVRLLDFITEENITVGADGTFEILIGGDEKGGRNRLSLPPRATSLLMRCYHRSPFETAAPMRIERVGAPAIPPPVNPADISRKLGLAARWARSNATIWANYVTERSRTKRNILTGFDDDGELGAPGGHKYLEGFWDVPADKALVLDFSPPDAVYWQVVICNYWMESLEWRFGAGVNVNNFDAVRRPDGSIRIVIAREKPRQPDVNWLATQNHTGGMICLRAARAKGPLPTVKSALVEASRV